jgi:phage terminase small subunit
MNDGIEFCPDYLDPVGIQAWKNITPKLWAKGLILPLDTDALAILCQIFSSYIRALEQAKEREKNAPEEAKILHEIAEDYRQSCRESATMFFAIQGERVHLTQMTDDGYDKELLETFSWTLPNQ